MTGYEQKCIKAACASFRKTAAAHDSLETRHRDDGNDHVADDHKTAAAGLRDGCDHLEKACALPADAKGGNGHASTVETNADGDSAAKRSTEQLDSLLQKDRTAEVLKAGTVPISASDPISELVADLNL
jgi:hypothetical protein